ncbi:MAG: RNA polymerase sigma factor [Clostridia bacterium]|nr:RNA polymerase sigma factor [Clostridia bacterium]
MEKTEQKDLKKNIRMAQRGSGEAFGALYAAYAPELYRFALWYMKDEDDAADAVQEACLLAFRNLKSLKNAAAFKSWFFKILSNTCKTALSKRNRLSVVSLDDEKTAYDAAYFDDTSDADALLSLLSDLDRQIVTMAVLGGFTSKEIAEHLGLKSGTVRSRLSRALAFLKRNLTEEEVLAI